MKKILLFSLGGLLLLSVVWILIAGIPGFLLPESSPAQTSELQGDFTGMSNPSAVYCQELGYEFNIVQEARGERGVCLLPENQECDAWDFLGGECGQEHSYCAQQGLETIVKQSGKNGLTQSYAVCVDETKAEVGLAAEMMDLNQKSLGCGVGLEETRPPDASGAEPAPPLAFAAPASFDWRNHEGGDWLPPIRNQASCGSCWAFAAVGVAESMINIGRDDPTYDLNLSEQYMVSDCLAHITYNNCCGGWKDDALEYIRDFGIPDDACMPYVDGTGCTCNGGTCDDTDSGPHSTPFARECNYRTIGECSDLQCSDRCGTWASELYYIQDYGYLGPDAPDNTIKQYLVDYGPLAVSVAIGSGEGGGFGKPGYATDVYSCDTANTNHAVVIVGYDDAGQYWIIRNSWGPIWPSPAEGGYYKLAYGECGVNKYPYYATFENLAPYTPSDPLPADAAGDVSVSSDLSWTGGDPDPGAITYDVYFEAGDITPDVLACDDAGSENCDPGILDLNTTYYWQVVSSDQYAESTTGPVWSFTTGTKDTVGVYDPANSIFYLKDSLSGGAADHTFMYGAAGQGWISLVGDWNNNGNDTIGVYNPTTGRFYLRNSLTSGVADYTYIYGAPGWIPIVGDWNNDGVDTVGVYNPVTSRFYLKNSHVGGPADITIMYGAAGAGWQPIAGDWDADGIDTLGVYDPSSSYFYLKNSLAGGPADVTIGYGAAGAGWIPLAGDWDADGFDTLGVYDPSSSYFYLKNSLAGGSADITFGYGAAGAGWKPLAGDW